MKKIGLVLLSFLFLFVACSTTNKIDENSSNDNENSDIYESSELYEDIPTYHHEEVERVSNELLRLKTLYPNNFAVGAISDNHVDVTNDNAMKSAKYAAFALDMVSRRSKCDVIINLGDNTTGSNIDSEVDYQNEVIMKNLTQYDTSLVDFYSLVGNHEKTNDTQMLYDLIGSFNSFDDYGTTQIRGYGYKDYTDKKVRLICLNTCDYWNGQGGYGMSYEQKDFFMRSLDLSNKTGYTDWTIVVMSHIPLDFKGGDYNTGADLEAILKAYAGYNGNTAVNITVNSSYANAQNEADKYSGTLTYDYNGKNQPKLISIHGHIHTNKVRKLKFIADNTELDIWRIATPNSSFYGNASTNRYSEYGDYSITTEEASKIEKVENTKADTSATFYFIDLDNQVIHSVGYGADIDRTLSYGDTKIYTIDYDLTLCDSINLIQQIADGESYTTVINPIDVDAVIESVKITMGGIDITSSCYSNGIIYIEKVTGNITISATAVDMYVPKWDINDRIGVQLDVAANKPKALNRKNYYYGVVGNGDFIPYTITNVVVDEANNTVTITPKEDERNVGVGVPYHLETGSTYQFSATCNQKGRLRVIQCDESGIFVSGSEVYSSSGQNLTLTVTAPTDSAYWVVLILDIYTVNVDTMYSNITFTKIS
jgi:hypothetical protein